MLRNLDQIKEKHKKILATFHWQQIDIETRYACTTNKKIMHEYI